MSPIQVGNGVCLAREDSHPLTGTMVELPLLLPEWQAAALEAAAHGRGLTAGQMMRSIIHEFFTKFAHGRPMEPMKRL